MIYLVTKSAFYYPRESVGDWRLVTPDVLRAYREFHSLNAKNEDVYLIMINPSNGDYSVLEERHA